MSKPFLDKPEFRQTEALYRLKRGDKLGERFYTYTDIATKKNKNSTFFALFEGAREIPVGGRKLIIDEKTSWSLRRLR